MLYQPGIFATAYLVDSWIICPVFAYFLRILFLVMILHLSVSVVHRVWNLIPFLVLESFLLVFDIVHVFLRPLNETCNEFI